MAVGEWDQRQLCPDGGCVGVIGPDGTCKVCGRAAQNWGDERTRGLNAPPDEEAAADEDEDNDEDDLEGEEDEEEDEGEDEGALDSPAAAGLEVAASSPPAEWGSRQLCPDGSCIGLIGADGKCKVCGRAASSAPPDDPGEPAAAGEPAATDTPSAPADATAPASETASTDKSGDGKLTV